MPWTDGGRWKNGRRSAVSGQNLKGMRKEGTVKEEWQFWIGWPVAILATGMMLPATKYLPESLRLPVIVSLPILLIIMLVCFLLRKR